MGRSLVLLLATAMLVACETAPPVPSGSEATPHVSFGVSLIGEIEIDEPQFRFVGGVIAHIGADDGVISTDSSLIILSGEFRVGNQTYRRSEQFAAEGSAWRSGDVVTFYSDMVPDYEAECVGTVGISHWDCVVGNSEFSLNAIAGVPLAVQ